MSRTEASGVQQEEELTADQWKTVDSIIEHHRSRPGALIPVLEEIQEAVGYLPKSIQKRVALGLRIPFSEVYGVVTFYSFFTMVPRGRHTIRVCLGTACYVRGSKKALDDLCHSLRLEPGGTTEDRRFSLETVRCLGACGLAPAMVIDTETFPQVKSARLGSILGEFE